MAQKKTFAHLQRMAAVRVRVRVRLRVRFRMRDRVWVWVRVRINQGYLGLRVSVSGREKFGVRIKVRED